MDEDLLYLRDNILPEAIARLNARLSFASAFVMRRSARSIKASRTVNVGRAEAMPGWRQNIEAVVLRVSDGKAMHARYTEEVTPEGIMRVTDALLSEFSRCGTFRLPERSSEVLTYHVPVKQPIESISLSDKIMYAKTLRERCMQPQGVASASIAYKELETQEVYVDANRRLAQRIPLVRVLVEVYVSGKNNDPTFNRIYQGGHCFESLSVSDDAIAEAVDIAKRMHSPIPVPTEKKLSVITDPSHTGTIAHEACGHPREGDTATYGLAGAMKYAGKMFGSRFVTLVTDPTCPGFGHYAFDHEGSIAEKVVLVDKGILTPEMITDRISAHYGGFRETAHGRRQDPAHLLMSRQSYTGFEAFSEAQGGISVGEMIERVDDGLMICGSYGGMEDPFGLTVQVNSLYGKEIKKGRFTGNITRFVKLDGLVPELLSSVTAVSRASETRPGGCGKWHKEYVPVGDGGPYLLFENVKVA